MAISVYFNPKGMTLAEFEEIHHRLDATGEDHAAGRVHHSCFGEEGDLMVYDIWESPEAFAEFGKLLQPILAAVGVDAGEPAVMPLHKLIQVQSG